MVLVVYQCQPSIINVRIRVGSNIHTKRQEQFFRPCHSTSHSTSLLSAALLCFDIRHVFFYRLVAGFYLSAISAVVLDSLQDPTTLTANSSPYYTFNGSSSNLTADPSQSPQNRMLVYCERGAEHRYGNPDSVSCGEAIGRIAKSTNVQTFGNRGGEMQGLNGLPDRFYKL